MKKSYESQVTHNSMRCDRATFGGLLQSIVEEFGGEPTRLTVTVASPGEELSFDSIDEFVEFHRVPERARITAYISDTYESRFHRRFTFHSGYSKPSTSATGESQAWCAGVVDVADAFARRHRTWYWWLRWWMPILVLFIVSQAPWLTRAAFKIDVTAGRAGAIAWLAALVVLALLAFRSDRLFPAFVLTEPHHQIWYRRYATEITIAAAAISAVAAVLSLVF